MLKTFVISFVIFSVLTTSVFAFAGDGFGGGETAKLSSECRKQAGLYILSQVDTPSPGTKEIFKSNEYLIRFGDRRDGKINAEIVTTLDEHLGPIWILKLREKSNGKCKVISAEYTGIGS